MSLTPEQERYHLIGNPNDVLFECIELSHPAITTHRFVRNHDKGLTVTHENGVVADYQYAPIKVDRGQSNEKLSQTITVTIGDLGMIIPTEVDKILDSEFELEHPTLTYRSFLSSNLNEPYETSRGLKVTENTPQKFGAVLKAKTRSLNDRKSFRKFSLDKWRALRGFLNG